MPNKPNRPNRIEAIGSIESERIYWAYRAYWAYRSYFYRSYFYHSYPPIAAITLAAIINVKFTLNLKSVIAECEKNCIFANK